METATEGRRTVQKTVIRQALDQREGFVSAQQLHSALEAAGDRVGIATVYRQLNALAAAGLADTITVDGEILYKACGDRTHHHHLVCERCGRSDQIDPPSESWIQSAAAARGYTVTRHVFEVFGLCADCAAA
ncbi:transcriptional repressor [Microbacterium sp. BWT-B31]|uniref:Fur family transcriptional regulator n=1 Tax=Microbacterium sp. BWT-B31 TaxID=3232072 RepID=UPI003528FA39